MPTEIVSRGLTLESMNKETRSVSFIASTDAIDSYEEVVDQENWRLERFLANPVILFGHNSRDLPVGKATRVEVVANRGRKQLECTVQFLSASANPMAEQVWQSVQEGGLRAVSVGFMPGSVKFEKRNGRDVYVLSNNELHEISVVPIPANPEAVAKMKAKARAEAGHVDNETAQAASELGMLTEKQMQELVAKAEAEKAVVEKQLAETSKAIDAMKVELRTIEGTLKSVEQERDAQKARAEKAETASLNAEVEALVGKKISPAEKNDFVELAKSNRPLFERMIALRSDMKLLGGEVVGDDKTKPEAVLDVASQTNGQALANKIFGS